MKNAAQHTWKISFDIAENETRQACCITKARSRPDLGSLLVSAWHLLASTAAMTPEERISTIKWTCFCSPSVPGGTAGINSPCCFWPTTKTYCKPLRENIEKIKMSNFKIHTTSINVIFWEISILRQINIKHKNYAISTHQHIKLWAIIIRATSKYLMKFGNKSANM